MPVRGKPSTRPTTDARALPAPRLREESRYGLGHLSVPDSALLVPAESRIDSGMTITSVQQQSDSAEDQEHNSSPRLENCIGWRLRAGDILQPPTPVREQTSYLGKPFTMRMIVKLTFDRK